MNGWSLVGIEHLGAESLTAIPFPRYVPLRNTNSCPSPSMNWEPRARRSITQAPFTSDLIRLAHITSALYGSDYGLKMAPWHGSFWTVVIDIGSRWGCINVIRATASCASERIRVKRDSWSHNSLKEGPEVLDGFGLRRVWMLTKPGTWISCDLSTMSMWGKT